MPYENISCPYKAEDAICCGCLTQREAFFALGGGPYDSKMF